MYHTESMIQMMEDLQRQASEMEKHVKDMMEAEGRACGIELDKRKNARDLMHQLMEHQANMEHKPEMTWAYVPADMPEYDTQPSEWHDDMHDDMQHQETLMETDMPADGTEHQQ